MSQTALPAQPLRTVDEFIAWGNEQGDARYEFIDGVIRAMVAPSVRHGRIGGNILGAFYAKLRGGPCQPFGADMALVVAEHLFKPDVTVSCVVEEGNRLRRPTLVVEVVSPSSERDDYGRKAEVYRTVPPLRHYLIVRQDRAEAVLFSRTSEAAPWVEETIGSDMPDARDGAAVVPLPGLAIEVTFEEIYEGVALDRG